MNFVALTRLATSPDVEAPLLAQELGGTAFEAGQQLRGVLPSVVLRTEDGARANALCASLRARGHGALVCDPASVVSHRAMFSPQRFLLEARGLVGIARQGPEQVVAWDDIAGLVRATHVAQVTQVGVEKGRAFSPGKAVLSGGLLLTKATEKEVRSQVTEKETVLYVFGRGGPPWLLAESGLKYEGLAQAMKPARLENFQTLVRMLRERAPAALFDDRLLQFRGGPGAPNTPETIDLLAHLIVLASAPNSAS